MHGNSDTLVERIRDFYYFKAIPKRLPRDSPRVYSITPEDFKRLTTIDCHCKDGLRVRRL